MNPIISIDNLTYRFGEKVAVEGLTLEVNAGEVFGFLGHNGAGKTTTIRLLNGILSPDAGQVRVLGMDPVSEGPVLRRYTGVLTETPALEELLTARDNLHIYADLYNVHQAVVASRVKELLVMFGLAEHAHEKVRGFSKGMKQRLALARAMLHKPDILFLDEPTDGLDPVAARLVCELITKLSREEKCTVFLCTHNLVEAQQLCDRVAVLEHGRLLALGTPIELIRQLKRGLRLRLDIQVSSRYLPLALETLLTVGGVKVHAEGNGEGGGKLAPLCVEGAGIEQIPTLVAMLVAANIPVYRVLPHEPSLEDVYFALHEEKEGLV